MGDEKAKKQKIARYAQIIILATITIIFINCAMLVPKQTPLAYRPHPPSWLFGYWSTRGQQDLRISWCFYIKSSSVRMTFGFPGNNIKLERLYEGYEIKEIITDKLYKLTFSKNDDIHTYEFKMLEEKPWGYDDGQMVSFEIIHDGKYEHKHSISYNEILMQEVE